MNKNMKPEMMPARWINKYDVAYFELYPGLYQLKFVFDESVSTVIYRPNFEQTPVDIIIMMQKDLGNL